MDNKSGRRVHLEDYWRHHGVKHYRFPVSKFLKEHKQSSLTGILLSILLVLLVGTFSQLQASGTSYPPPDVTVVDYNVFVEQVKASNVLTVTVQGNEITGTLKHTLHGQACSTPAATTYEPFTGMELGPSAPSTCTIFTYLPVRGGATLLAVLLSQDIVVNTRPANKSSIWLSLLWKVTPIILFLFLVLSLPPRKGMFSLHTMDNKIKQFARSRAPRTHS